MKQIAANLVRDRLHDILTILFWFIFLVVTGLCIWRTGYIKYGHFEHSKYFIVLLLYSATIMISIGLNKIESKNRPASIALLFLLCLIIRVQALNLMGYRDAVQVSDFLGAYECSLLPWGKMGIKPIVFPNWGMPPVYYKVLAFFGLRSIPSLLLFQAVLMCFSSILIYSLVGEAVQDSLKGYFSAIIFTIWPQFLMYEIVLTPEIPSIFFLLLAIWTGIRGLKTKTKRNHVILIICSGVLLAFSGSLKAMDYVVIIACAILLILQLLRNVQRNLILSFVVMVVAWGAGQFLCNLIVEQSVSHETNPSPDTYYLRTGLNKESLGRYSPEIGTQYYQLMMETDYDFDNVNQILMRDLLNEIQSEHHLTTSFFLDKLHTAYCSDVILFSESSMSENSYMKQNDIYMRTLSITHLWYQSCIIWMGLGGIIALLRRDSNLIMFSALLWIGLLCMIVFLSETQTRYKIITYPYASIIIGSTIFDVIQHMITLLKRGQEKWKN